MKTKYKKIKLDCGHFLGLSEIKRFQKNHEGKKVTWDIIPCKDGLGYLLYMTMDVEKK